VAILKYNATPRPSASVKNVAYILRDDACVQFGTINLPEIENKIDALSYASTRKFEEELMPQRGTGIPRNHYRMVLTMPNENDPDAALQLATQFIKNEFPGTRSIIAVHKSENGIGLHCHAWVDARKIDGKKLDLGTKYKSLDRLYSRNYDAVYKTNFTAEFAAARKFNAENKIPTYEKQLQILKGTQEKNEQRRTLIGKHITSAASRKIVESEQRIAEANLAAQWNPIQPKLARANRQSMEQDSGKLPIGSNQNTQQCGPKLNSKAEQQRTESVTGRRTRSP
jgi:hypothetical protein